MPNNGLVFAGSNFDLYIKLQYFRQKAFPAKTK